MSTVGEEQTQLSWRMPQATTTQPLDNLVLSSAYPRLLWSHENNASVHFNEGLSFHMHYSILFLTQRKEVSLWSMPSKWSRTNLSASGLVHFLPHRTPLRKGMPLLRFGEPKPRSISLIKSLPGYHATVKIDLYVLSWGDAHCWWKKQVTEYVYYNCI